MPGARQKLDAALARGLPPIMPDDPFEGISPFGPRRLFPRPAYEAVGEIPLDELEDEELLYANTRAGAEEAAIRAQMQRDQQDRGNALGLGPVTRPFVDMATDPTKRQRIGENFEAFGENLSEFGREAMRAMPTGLPSQEEWQEGLRLAGEDFSGAQADVQRAAEAAPGQVSRATQAAPGALAQTGRDVLSGIMAHPIGREIAPLAPLGPAAPIGALIAAPFMPNARAAVLEAAPQVPRVAGEIGRAVTYGPWEDERQLQYELDAARFMEEAGFGDPEQTRELADEGLRQAGWAGFNLAFASADVPVVARGAGAVASRLGGRQAAEAAVEAPLRGRRLGEPPVIEGEFSAVDGPRDPFAAYPELPVATEAPPGKSPENALATARMWVEDFGGGAEGERRAIGVLEAELRKLPDDSAHVSVPVQRRDFERMIDAVRTGEYRQGERNMRSARVEEAFPELYASRAVDAPRPPMQGDPLEGVGIGGVADDVGSPTEQQAYLDYLRSEGYDVDRPLYRGGGPGAAERGGFRLGEGLDGRAVYLTDRPAVANEYARSSWPNGLDADPIHGDGGTVYPVFSRNAQAMDNNTFIVRDPADVVPAYGRAPSRLPEGSAETDPLGGISTEGAPRSRLGDTASTAALGGGALGGAMLMGGEAEAEENPELGAAQAEVDSLEADAALLARASASRTDGTPPEESKLLIEQAQTMLQGRGLYDYEVDGDWGGIMRSASSAFETQQAERMETAQARVTELEMRGLTPNAAIQTARVAAPWAVGVGALYAGHRLRGGGVRAAERELAERDARVGAMVDTGPILTGKTADSRAEPTRRMGRMNDFWDEGGEGQRAPFRRAEGGGFEQNLDAAPGADLFPPENAFLRIPDYAVFGGGTAEAAFTYEMWRQAEEEETAAEEAFEAPGGRNATNLALLEAARNKVALWETANRVGLGLMIGRASGLGHRYPTARPPSVGAAESEVALLNEHLTARAARSRPRTSQAAPPPPPAPPPPDLPELPALPEAAAPPRPAPRPRKRRAPRPGFR